MSPAVRYQVWSVSELWTGRTSDPFVCVSSPERNKRGCAADQLLALKSAVLIL